MHAEAQTPLSRFVVDILYNHVSNKYIYNGGSMFTVWSVVQETGVMWERQQQMAELNSLLLSSKHNIRASTIIIIIIIINDTYKAQIRKKKSTNALLAVKQVCLQLFPSELSTH